MDVISVAPLLQRSVGPFGQYGQWPTFHCQLKPFARARERVSSIPIPSSDHDGIRVRDHS